MRKWLIEEWCVAWRFSSLWVAAAGFGVLTVWNMMPPAVRAFVPDWIELCIGVPLWLAVLAARVWRQPGAEAAFAARRQDRG